jgi:hypothetical protein
MAAGVTTARPLPISRPYDARAEHLPVSYAPGVKPDPELERRLADRDAEARQHPAEARARRRQHESAR